MTASSESGERGAYTISRLGEAAKRRKAMLSSLRRVVRDCDCAWPIQVYRNGHGHHPTCPAANLARFTEAMAARSARDLSGSTVEQSS